MANLTPEEQAYIDFSQNNLNQGTAVYNPDGTVSTVRGIIVNIDGQEVLIPTVWGGNILPVQESIQKARESGIKFPSYGNVSDAEKTEMFLKENYINSQSPQTEIGIQQKKDFEFQKKKDEMIKSLFLR